MKIVHPVWDTGIRAHILLITSLVPERVDQRYPPSTSNYVSYFFILKPYLLHYGTYLEQNEFKVGNAFIPNGS